MRLRRSGCSACSARRVRRAPRTPPGRRPAAGGTRSARAAEARRPALRRMRHRAQEPGTRAPSRRRCHARCRGRARPGRARRSPPSSRAWGSRVDRDRAPRRSVARPMPRSQLGARGGRVPPDSPSARVRRRGAPAGSPGRWARADRPSRSRSPRAPVPCARPPPRLAGRRGRSPARGAWGRAAPRDVRRECYRRARRRAARRTPARARRSPPARRGGGRTASRPVQS